MKTLFLTIVFAFSIYFTKANPVMPHPLVITELHFDNNDNWILELKNGFDFYSLDNLNNIRLTTSTGSYYFKQGINLTTDQLFLVNNDSLIAPMTINRNNDFIKIEEDYGNNTWNEIGVYLSFGSNPSFAITPIGLNESIELFQCNESSFYERNIYVKSTESSLGVFPAPNLLNTSKGFLKGYVYDRNNNPITNTPIIIYYYPCIHGYSSYFYANQQSGFISQETYSCRYQLSIRLSNFNNPRIDTTVVIEPGDTTNCIFHLDCVSGINSKENSIISDIYNYPNPVNESTNFTFKLNSNTAISKGIIKIFNNNGEIVKILPVSLSNLNGNKYSIPLNINNDNAFVPGIYYYYLEINGTKVGSNKMTVIK